MSDQKLQEFVVDLYNEYDERVKTYFLPANMPVFDVAHEVMRRAKDDDIEYEVASIRRFGNPVLLGEIRNGGVRVF